MYNSENLRSLVNNGNCNLYFYFNSGNDTVTTSGYFNDVRLTIGDLIVSYNGSSVLSYKVTAKVGNAKTVSLIATDTKAVWGSVTGTLSNQTDLNTALGGKFDKPTAPTEDGTYTLKATASDGAVTYAWVADE